MNLKRRAELPREIKNQLLRRTTHTRDPRTPEVHRIASLLQDLTRFSRARLLVALERGVRGKHLVRAQALCEKLVGTNLPNSQQRTDICVAIRFLSKGGVPNPEYLKAAQKTEDTVPSSRTHDSSNIVDMRIQNRREKARMVVANLIKRSPVQQLAVLQASITPCIREVSKAIGQTRGEHIDRLFSTLRVSQSTAGGREECRELLAEIRRQAAALNPPVTIERLQELVKIVPTAEQVADWMENLGQHHLQSLTGIRVKRMELYNEESFMMSGQNCTDNVRFTLGVGKLTVPDSWKLIQLAVPIYQKRHGTSTS